MPVDGMTGCLEDMKEKKSSFVSGTCAEYHDQENASLNRGLIKKHREWLTRAFGSRLLD